MIHTVPLEIAVLRMAGAFAFVREEGVNDGQAVRAFQKITGNKPPDKWCASVAVYVLYHTLGPHLFATLGIPKSASCDDLRLALKARGALHEKPRVGDLFFTMSSPSDASHTGFVADVPAVGFKTSEGNAADPRRPQSRDGNGFYTGRVRGLSSDPRKYEFGRWIDCLSPSR